MSLHPGTRLGNYEVISELGSGGMGEVYKARDLKLGREVAIKVLPQEMASDSDRLRRFEQEARAASALNHPNIVTIYEIGDHEGAPFIAMEYVDGVTLREMLAGGALPHDKLIRYASQMAEGLAKAHKAGIVHRDVKPDNIVVSDDGYIKILDFGLAKFLAHGVVGSEIATSVKEATTPGTILGTVGYMSPEQAQGESADFRSDQFSLGAILYEMATGTRAFARASSAQTLTAIIEDDPAPVTLLNPSIPGHLASVIDRCLSKKPSERYESTWDLAKQIHSETLVIPKQPSERHPLATAGVGGLLAIILVMILGLFVSDIREWVVGEADAPRIESIAVLPLENLSGDPDEEYFADGMTEALIADLAQIEALKVISRTSAMRYKNTEKSLPEIAEELNVNGIVEGSVMRIGEQVRITVQLIHATTDELLWAKSYERDLKDVLYLQSEVAQAVASEIQVAVTPSVMERLGSARPIDPEAHDAYLRGRYYWNKRTGADITRGMDYFRRAVDLDPLYALAHAGLADSWFAIGWYSVEAPTDAYSEARASALEALELDDRLGEAHISLGMVAHHFDWDWAAAEREYRRGIELSPGYATGHHLYGTHLSAVGQHDDAIAQAELARELDPLSLIVNTWLGVHYYFARQPDLAFEQYRRTAELNPDFVPLLWHLGWLYEAEGLHAEALEAYEKAVRLSDESPLYIAALAQALALTGDTEQALERLDELMELSQRRHVPAYQIAMIHFRLGQTDEAFAWFEKAYEQRSPRLPFINVEPRLDSLRDDPRFQDLLRRMNFPD